jgi:hypothetical protein
MEQIRIPSKQCIYMGRFKQKYHKEIESILAPLKTNPNLLVCLSLGTPYPTADTVLILNIHALNGTNYNTDDLNKQLKKYH